MREDVARHDHVGLVAVHREPVHPQELGQQRVSVALHDELDATGEVPSIHKPPPTPTR